MSQDANVFQTAEEHFLVVSGQHLDSPLGLPPPGAFHHCCAVRPSIDEIAKENHGRLRGPGCSIVAFDRRDEDFEQIEAPVYVANRIPASALRNPGLGAGRRLA
ncbi:hypothetical protein GCM10011515_18690 [Tsuneonella deserti]|uniref:Uncharacterized protein n=1 Tax=Tsuneonella deserti TaxID=2035528 RepID=A0ABQ1S904_9SPHN|nr:hypothetical protein GCM10011515_18690 [Tsuneonella deserti]